jgi:hypothetical protein
VSAEIINLRQARKQRARDEKTAKAAENRTRFGRSKSERELEDEAHARSKRVLDGHRLEPTSAVDDARPRDPDPKPPR